VLLAVVAALEHHLEADPEQKQPACDPEGGEPDPEESQENLAAKPEESENAEGDEAARTATRRRSPAVIPRVSDRKIGASPTGSTATRRVTSAETR
jgi:hypothetical protein